MRRRRRNPPGNTKRKGYGTEHQRERRKWEPVVAAGNAYCRQPICVMPFGRKIGRWIPPWSDWHLGHNDARTAWIGPVHAKCNAVDGAIKAAAAQARRTRPRPATPSPTTPAPLVRTSRRW